MISNKLSIFCQCLIVGLFLTTSVYAQSYGTGSTYALIHGVQRPIERVGPVISPAQPLQTIQGRPLYAPGEIIVKYYDNASVNDKSRVRTRQGFTLKHKHQYLNCETLKMPTVMQAQSQSIKAMQSICSDVMKDPAVQFAEPNYYVYALEGFGYYPNDPYFGSDTQRTFDGVDIGGGIITYYSTDPPLTTYREWNHQWNYIAEGFAVDPPPQYQDELLGYKITPGAWDITRGSSNVKVAVIDTGVMLSHEDLRGKILPGYNYISKTANPDDDNGHGTHCAGLIAAQSDNYKGGAGSAPNVMIIPIKVLDSAGTGTDDIVTEGIIGAVEKFKANILNMSFGENTNSLLMESAINQVITDGAIPVAAAGNDGTDFSTVTECSIQGGNSQLIHGSYPAFYNKVICVGSWEYQYDQATRQPIKVAYSNFGFVTSGRSACFDNWGVEVFADGGGPWSLVWSTFKYSVLQGASMTQKYQALQGTSMASPQVAGLAALLYSQGIQDLDAITLALWSTSFDPTTTANTVSEYTIGNYTYRTGLWYGHPQPEWGFGAIDALAALVSYQPTVNVAYVSSQFLDSTTQGAIGNGDGILDPGETVGMMITLKNSGTLHLSNIVGVLRSTDTVARVLTSTQTYPDVLSGLNTISQGPYVVSVNDFNIGNGYTVRFILDVTVTSINGTQTFHLPIDIPLSQQTRFTSTGGIYHQIDLDPTLYQTFVDDSNVNNRTGSLIPNRTDTDTNCNLDTVPAGNNQDGYLNNGEYVGINPSIFNNTPTTFYGIGTAPSFCQGIATYSGIYGNLRVDQDTQRLLSIVDNGEIYYTETTLINNAFSYVTERGQIYSTIVGYCTTNSVASTEFDYNLFVSGDNANGSLDPDKYYGNAILEFDLHAPADLTANWLDHIPVSYAAETSISFDYYEIVDDPNRDQLIEPGETIRLGAHIRNNSALPVLPDSFATLSGDPYITLSVPLASYTTLLYPKQSVGPDISGFEFTVSPNTPQNHKITFDLMINGQLDTSSLDSSSTVFKPTQTAWDCPFIVEMGELVLYEGNNGHYSIKYDDSPNGNDLSIGAYNNEDGAVNPGEEINMTLSLWNRHYDQAIMGVSAVLTTATPDVHILNNTSFTGDIGARQIVTIPKPFKFYTPISFSAATIDWTLILTDSLGHQYVNTFSTLMSNNYPPQVPGFPYNTGAAIRSSPTIVDLNKDGVSDIVVGNEAGVITAISLTATKPIPVPGWPVQLPLDHGTTFAIRYPIAVGDIDNTTTNSVVIVPENNKLYAYHANGALYNGTGLLADLTPDDVLITTPPVLADLNLDGSKEIIFGATVNIGTTSVGAIYAIDHNGNPVGIFGKVSTALQGPITAPPAVGNIAGDDYPEIIVVTQHGEVAGYTHDGNQFFLQQAGGPINSPAVLGDIEQTGQPDIIVKCGDGNVYAWRPDGTKVPGFPINTGGSVITPPALGDVFGVGNVDILVGGTDRLYVITISSGVGNINGYIYFQPPFQNGFIDSQPAIANLYHSTVPQIIVTDNYGALHVADFQLLKEIYHTNALKFQDSSPGVLRFPNPNAINIGGDGTNNAVIVTSRDGNIYAYISVFDTNPSLGFWPQYRHEPSHSGLFEPPQNSFIYSTFWSTNKVPYRGRFDFIGDVNWLSFNGLADHLYRITVTTPAGSTASPQIALYDPTGDISMAGPTAPQIEHAVPTSDMYYVKVTNKNNNFGINAIYDVTIEDVSALTYIPLELWKDISE